MRTPTEDSARAESTPKQAWSKPMLAVHSISTITRNGNASSCDGPFTGNRGRNCRIR